MGGLNILITAGGTEEPIDGVRRLVNTSTGATGLAIANTLRERGANVFLLHSARVDAGGFAGETGSFLSFDELAGSLQRLLGERNFDAIIHLAAVSDYRLASIEVDGVPVETARRGKIGSGHELLLRMAPNPKLIDSLRSWSTNPGLKVVGFKLTDEAEPALRLSQVQSLLHRGVADFVVHNDISEIGKNHHVAAVFSKHGVIGKTRNKTELAGALYELLAAGETA